MLDHSSTAVAKPQPRVTELTRPFWEGALDGRLRIQRCANPACAKAVFYPRVCCPHCHGERLDWIDANGHGRVVSHTTVRRTHHDGFNADAPYVFAAIELAEGVLIYAQLLGAPTEAASLIGRSVTVEFVDHGVSCRMPAFRLGA